MPGKARVSELTDHLGFWLRAVSNHVSHSFAEKLAAEGVSVAEWVMLRMLHDVERMPPSVLAGKMEMTRGGVTKLADRLIKRSLVERRASPDDGRAQTLELTPQGRKLVPRLAALADRNDEEFFGLLTTSHRRTLERLLKQLVKRSAMPAMPTE
jgi:DNA-binding MarR family transcriptional regulator